MSEGIEYKPTGVIEIETEDQTYTLGRPKLKQWRWFTRRIDEMTTKAQEDLRQLAADLAACQQTILAEADPTLRGVWELADQHVSEGAAEHQAREVAWRDVYEAASDELRGEYETAKRTLTEFTATPFYTRSSEILREMVKQLGDHPLPDDIDDWPAWLAADVSLPTQILTHWRRAPKVSGSNGTG